MQFEGNTLRHELKYYINEGVYHTLKNRLKYLTVTDKNMKNEEGYIISSIYFDDVYKTAYNEKISGIRFRKKFRIRVYNYSDNVIKLECKKKYDDYISKKSVNLTRVEYNSILKGDYDFLAQKEEVVCKELLAYNRTRLLKPVVTVEYMREVFIYPHGNVRITFDKDISASINTVDIFSKDYITTKVLPEKMMVLEVKYDEYLPASIHKIISMVASDRSAISKYVMCRENNGRVGIL